MKKSLINKPLALTAAVLLAFGLAGCTNDAPTEEKTTPSTEKTQAETPEPEETEAEETEAAAPTGDTPEWAEGSLDAGELLGEISLPSFTVKVYQVGTATTDKDSMFVDSDTGANLLPAGSEVVYLNFVYTNTSSEAFPLSYSLGSPTASSESWAYIGGQPSFSSRDAYEALGLSDDGSVTGSDAPFIVGPGQSFSQATNLLYVPGDATVVEVTLIPVDDAGDLIHDKKEEGEITVTIK